MAPGIEIIVNNTITITADIPVCALANFHCQ